MSDLYDPTPDRTINILSALINFCKFIDEREPLFSTLRQKSLDAMEERDQLAYKLEEMQTKVGEIR